MKFSTLAPLVISLFAVTACDDAKNDAKPANETSAKTEQAGEAKPAGDTKKTAAEDAPDCDKVVDQIASLNEGSGDAERKLWNKMCEEMTPEQRTCVASMKEMSGMKDCMGKKGDEKLK